jgi:DNA polymerase-3 subunit alpha
LSFDEFKSISDNIIKISACLASPLNKLRDESLIQYYDYLEIQPHVISDDQKEYNKWLYQMSIKHKKPLIAGTDTHSINKYKAECRSILQKAKHIEFTNEDEFDLTYKSYDELVDMFKQQASLPEEVYLEAIENTNMMANSVEDFELDKNLKKEIEEFEIKNIPTIYELIEKYKNGRRIVIFKSREEADDFLSNQTDNIKI